MKKINAILKLSVFVLLVVLMASCNKEDEEPERIINTPAMEAAQIANWLDTMKARDNHVYSLNSDSGTLLYYIKIDSTGTGELIKTGDEVTVEYTGMFLDGTVFDSSVTADSRPDTYIYVHKGTNDENRMIAGWEAGIELMKKGETTAFLFPSAQAYGATGSAYGVIPPYTPLIFVIEVIDIK